MDLISTTALAAADKRQAVSVTISVDFYAPLPIGEDLEVEAHMVKPGKTLTFAEINFRWVTVAAAATWKDCPKKSLQALCIRANVLLTPI